MSAPLRILHVTTYVHPDRFGGAERVVHELARAQAQAGHEVVIVTGNHDQRKSDELREGVRYLRFPMPPGVQGFGFYRAARGGCRAMLRELAGREFHLVHTHQPATAESALGLRHLALARIHSFYAPYNAEWAVEQGLLDPGARPNLGLRLRRRALALLDRRCLMRADRVVVLSETSRRQAELICPGIASRIECVPPGVDRKRFHPGPARMNNPRPLVVSVRRLVHRMGLDLALEAAARLRDQDRAFDLLIVGAGPQFSSLSAKIRELRLSDRVRLCGPVPEHELPALYRQADLFLLPTRSLEGFGMVTLEALASGTPVVGTAVGATGELLRHLILELAPVFCCSGRIAAALGAALDRLEPLREAAQRASEQIADQYNWASAAERLEQVYREALARELVS